jgi:hypothetical protein
MYLNGRLIYLFIYLCKWLAVVYVFKWQAYLFIYLYKWRAVVYVFKWQAYLFIYRNGGLLFNYVFI